MDQSQPRRTRTQKEEARRRIDAVNADGVEDRDLNTKWITQRAERATA
jgi:hypothetical protein